MILDPKVQAELDQEIYQDRLRSYKQLEHEIKSSQEEMSRQFKQQHLEVSKYEAENKALQTELASLDHQIKQNLNLKAKGDQQAQKIL
jgi:hypothetical protein